MYWIAGIIFFLQLAALFISFHNGFTKGFDGAVQLDIAVRAVICYFIYVFFLKDENKG